MSRYLLLLSLAVIITATGWAAEPGDVVTRTGNKLHIKSTVLAPNGCYSAGQATPGAPATQLKVENAVLVTFPLKSGGGICTQALKPVDFSIITDIPKDAQAIIIYTVDESSQSTSARAVALPGK
jgi:hypothetical protein